MQISLPVAMVENTLCKNNDNNENQCDLKIDNY